MDLIREFFRDKTLARLAMLAAILLLFASQFFLYLNDEGSGVLVNAMSTEYYAEYIQTAPTQVGTGWELHPHAYVILLVLAFAFLRDDIVGATWFSRFGWWGALVLIVAATAPGAYFRDAPGGAMGGIAVLIALGAVLLHLREGRTRAIPTSDAEKAERQTLR